MLTIVGDGESHLTIGGGAGQYVVYAAFDNEVFWNLFRPQDASGRIILVGGGQEGDFPVPRWSTWTKPLRQDVCS
jgi:hypothetical protein